MRLKQKNKTLSKCSKAKMDPVIRSKHAVENEFIDLAIAEKLQIIAKKCSRK